MNPYPIDEQGIATLSGDFATIVSNIDGAVRDSAVKAILLTPTTPGSVLGGDLEPQSTGDDAEVLFARAMARHRSMRQLECCGKPVAAALSGSALGGALEIALASHYRVSADNEQARLGLPEVTQGRMPGGGATQRLPRLIGIQNALPLLLDGKCLNAQEALQLGLLNAVVAAGTEVEAARAWLLAQTAPVPQPWDTKGFKIPGGAVSSPAVQQCLMLANARMRAQNLGEVTQHILSCVYEGLITDIDTGLKTEARYFVHSLLTSARPAR